MAKPIWLLILCILIYLTTAFGAHEKRGDCDYDKPKKTSTEITHKPTPTHTSITVIAVTVTDKVTATHIPSTLPKNNTSSREHCHTCENSCEHSCSESPCGHTCKDGPCHIVCIYKTRKLNTFVTQQQ